MSNWARPVPPIVVTSCPTHGNEQVPLSEVRLLIRFTEQFVLNWHCRESGDQFFQDISDHIALHLVDAGLKPLTYDEVLEEHNRQANRTEAT